MSEIDQLYAEVKRLKERLAKLEARTDAAWGPRPTVTFEQLVTKVGPLPMTCLASAESPPPGARAITKITDLPCNTAESNESDRSPLASGKLVTV